MPLLFLGILLIVHSVSLSQVEPVELVSLLSKLAIRCMCTERGKFLKANYKLPRRD